MHFEVKWGFSLEFPWLDKIHDFVWEGDEENED